jgi:hypothetical protein
LAVLIQGFGFGIGNRGPGRWRSLAVVAWARADPEFSWLAAVLENYAREAAYLQPVITNF